MAPSSTSNPLSAGSLANTIASSLPKHASPQIKTAYDAIALAVHAAMTAVGFKLVGLGEDHRLESPVETSGTQPLPQEWNSSSTYSFRYSHDQSAMQFVVKVGRLGSKAVVDAIALGDDRRTSFDVLVQDYISASSLPATPVPNNSEEDSADTSSTIQRAIQDIFISAARLSDLSSLVKAQVIQKLLPGLHKEGYEESNTETASSSTQQSSREGPTRQPPPDPLAVGPRNPYSPFNDPLRIPQQPRRPPVPGEEPPGFEDEYDVFRGPRGGMGGPGARNPLSIGHDDLYPPGLGPHDPLRPHFGPGGGLPRPGGGSGGMHPTFDDPLFGGGSSGSGDLQMPPGARYDPTGPSDPRGGPRGFPGAGHRGPGGGPPNPFGGYGSGDFI